MLLGRACAPCESFAALCIVVAFKQRAPYLQTISAGCSVVKAREVPPEEVELCRVLQHLLDGNPVERNRYSDEDISIDREEQMVHAAVEVGHMRCSWLMLIALSRHKLFF